MGRELIKIATGYSDKGGSTSALIKLTNEFNKNNIETTLYGPHDYHLDKCRAKKLHEIKTGPNSNIIFHFLALHKRPPARKVVLSCHEKWWFKVGEIYKYWDTAVFLHKQHQEYHQEYSYNGDYTIIPNLKPNLVARKKPELDLVAGIIGSIEDRKQTHVSIQRALKDGCTLIKLYGG